MGFDMPHPGEICGINIAAYQVAAPYNTKSSNPKLPKVGREGVTMDLPGQTWPEKCGGPGGHRANIKACGGSRSREARVHDSAPHYFLQKNKQTKQIALFQNELSDEVRSVGQDDKSPAPSTKHSETMR